jgi:hypothetical protein
MWICVLAAAAELEERAPVVLPHVATRLYTYEGGPNVLFVGPDAVDVYDPGDGSFVTLERGGNDVIVVDGPALRLCADDGIWAVPWASPSTFGAPTLLSAEPCARIGAVGGGVVTVGASVIRWEGEDTLTEYGDYGPMADPVLLASNGYRVLAASEGADALLMIASGTVTYEAGGSVGGVGVIDGVGVWSITDLGVLRDATGVDTPVAAEPGALAVADFDDDGQDDAAVLHPTAVGVLSRAEESTVAVEGWAGPLVAVPTDTCPEVWGLDTTGTEARRAGVVECGYDADYDADGHTVRAGDCDDHDADVYPGAPDGCDGVDRSCDGVLDTWGAGDWLPDGIAVLEGKTALLALDSECLPLVEVSWTFPATLACDADATTLRCAAVDEGESTVGADVYLDGTLVDTRAMTVTVLNVDPVLSNIDDVLDDLMGAEVGRRVRIRLVGTDAPADRLSFRFEGGAPTFEMGDDGAIDWTPTEDDLGRFDTTLFVEDEDGGVATMSFTTSVEWSNGWALDCGGSSALFLLPLLGLRRRRPWLATLHSPPGGPRP